MDSGKDRKKTRKAPGKTSKKLDRDSWKPLSKPVRFPGNRIQVKHTY